MISAHQDNRTRSMLDVLYLPGILVLILLVRLYAIWDESAWCDEVFAMGWLPADSLGAYMEALWLFDFNAPLTPLYFWILYAWANLFGTELLALRGLSLVFTLLSVPLLYRLVHRLFGQDAARYTLLLFAVHPMFTHFGQEIRFYALMVFLMLLSTEALCMATLEKRTWAWVLHILANLALILTHAFGPILYGVQGLVLLWYWRKQYRAVLYWGGVHLIICMVLPLSMYLNTYSLSAHSGGLSGALPGWREAANALVVFAGGRFRRFDPAPYMPFGISLDIILTGLVLMIGAFTVLWGFSRTYLRPIDSRLKLQQRFGLVFTVVLLVFPLLFLYLGSWAYRNMFFYRYVIYSALAFPIILGFGCSLIHSIVLRRGLLTLLVALMAYQNFAVRHPLRADYQSLAEDIQSDGNPRVYSLKALNHWGIWYALGAERHFIDTLVYTPDWQPHHLIMAMEEQQDGSQAMYYDSYSALCDAVIRDIKLGNPHWVTFYHWDRCSDFESMLRQNNITIEKFVYRGIPPLYAYRIVGAPE